VLQSSPFSFMNTSSRCELWHTFSCLIALNLEYRDLEIQYIWTGRISATSIFFFLVRSTLNKLGSCHNETSRIATTPSCEPRYVYTMRSIRLQAEQREGVNSREYPSRRPSRSFSCALSKNFNSWSTILNLLTVESG